MVLRGSRKWPVLGALCGLLVLLGSCSVERALPAPDCVRGESGLIVAQSVPGAELVPCLTTLPVGWSVDTVSITEDGTAIVFDSDRAGDNAARLRYDTACEPGDAVSIPSGMAGVLAFEYIERLEPGFRGSRFFRFDGGCVWWRFDFDVGVSAALSIELGNALTLLSRDAINDSIRESFIDEEL